MNLFPWLSQPCMVGLSPWSTPLHFLAVCLSLIQFLPHGVLTVPSKSQSHPYLVALCLLLSWFQIPFPAVPITCFLTFFRSALILPPQRHLFQPPYLHPVAQGPPILSSPQYFVLLLYFTFLHLSSSDILYIYLFGYCLSISPHQNIKQDIHSCFVH